MPVRIFTMVDLPAPFSPINAVTSPASRLNAMSWSARTPGKDLETPVRDRIGDVSPAMKFADVAKVTRTGRNETAKTLACARRFADQAGGGTVGPRPDGRGAGPTKKIFGIFLRSSFCKH